MLPPVAGKGRTRLYVDDKPLLVSSDLMVGLPVPEAELAQFTPEQVRITRFALLPHYVVLLVSLH